MAEPGLRKSVCAGIRLGELPSKLGLGLNNAHNKRARGRQKYWHLSHLIANKVRNLAYK